MTEMEERGNMPQIQSGPLIIGGVLVGVGTMLVIAGIAVGSSHVFAATRRWINEMETPPSELARQKWAQARAAAAAGTAAWQNGVQARKTTA
jgi:hypothetical protein